MKYIISLLFGLLISINTSAATPEPDLKVVSDLLHILNISHKNNPDSIIQSANKSWGRKPGIERWELPEPKVTLDERTKILNNLKTLGLTGVLEPSLQHYRYVMILGATVPRMQKRLAHFIALWEQGLRTDEIVFLTGQRPLIPEIDKMEELANAWLKQAPTGTGYGDIIPQHEAEALKMLFHLMPMPEELRKVKTTYVDTPRFLRDGRWERPYTAMNAAHWLERKPEPGTVLAFSNQPHALYQYEALREYIPAEYKMEIAAAAAREEAPLAEYLDALRLWLNKYSQRNPYPQQGQQ